MNLPGHLLKWSTRVRIGFAVYGSFETLSGGYLYDRRLVEYLQSQGDELEIISLPWQNYFFHLSQNFIQSYIDRFYKLDIDIFNSGRTKPSLVYLDEQQDLTKNGLSDYFYGASFTNQ